MAKRCKRNGELTDRVHLTPILKDEISSYLNVCVINPEHTGVIKDPRYVFRKCLRLGKKPCPHYRRYRDEAAYKDFVLEETIELKIE